ncbi:hypothetical protein ACPV5V_05065 [Vibrio campbellii]|uniref:hypothetical protein n=1 Tax=Vibrio parahaemolyticus TaxID=670 RepID=UPI001122D5C8|nr:hypothetical protein [Vibrio parahaemolyticus]TOC13213.1 hypothetical protein CGJ91_11430 [Vibrio parahaemolyticus]TOQ98379.1 hypothetical protein CGG85_04345 [Vibrio parahaemolyticus]
MPYMSEHKQKFSDLDFNINNQDQLRRKANGGNSIIFSYQPCEEHLYLEKAREIYRDKAEFIDVSELLVKFIDVDGWEAFSEYYQDFSNTPHVVFKSDDPEMDLFDLIISAIKKASDSDKIPFLIRSGCLYGTGIENVNIMEQRDIMNLKHPLVLFYPSKIEDENIYFLNFKPASKYRCILVK